MKTPVRRFTAEPFYRPETEELRYLPECPRVLRNPPGGGATLAWEAIQHGKQSRYGSLNLLDLKTLKNVNIPLPGRPGFFAETTRRGVLLVGIERRLILLDVLSGAVSETGIRLPDDERVIINDGLAIPGGLLFGTKHLEFNLPIAALYYYDCGSRDLREVIGGQMCSNGKYYRAGTLIDIDTQPKNITRYQLDSRMHIRSSSLVVPPQSLPALPDGMRPSPGGDTVIVAFYNLDRAPSGVAQEIRLSDGVLETEWELPGSPRVTCPEFVTIDGRVYVLFTTAVEGMADPPPHAGTLFLGETEYDREPDPPPLVPAEAF